MLERIVQRFTGSCARYHRLPRDQHDGRALGEAAWWSVASLLAALGAGWVSPFIRGFAVEFLANPPTSFSELGTCSSARGLSSHATAEWPVPRLCQRLASGHSDILGCIFGPLVGLAAWVLAGRRRHRRARGQELTTERAIDGRRRLGGGPLAVSC